MLIKNRGNFFRNHGSPFKPRYKKKTDYLRNLKNVKPQLLKQNHNEYRHYRNWLSTLIKENLQKYFNDYSQNNVKNIKNT